ncbi:YadA-like family protein [Pasteurella sp. PK-2025]|uniref:YadA C-terminal domain-containing protein n=1 Tax=Pasteurella sp. PK-2025 TaxID=3413133 RepID=UPI003C7742FC
MNKIKVMAFSCSLVISTFSYAAQTEPKATEQNLAENISNIVYHSAQLPRVLYENEEIVRKMLRGQVVKPSSSLFDTFLNGATSLLNGDMNKLIKLSTSLGPHIKAIEDNSLAIKQSAQKSLPNSVVNLISNAPQQMLKVANNTLDYAANNAVERSTTYQETKKGVEKNSKDLAEQKKLIEKNQREADRALQTVKRDANKDLQVVKKETENNKKVAETMQQEFVKVQKDIAEQFEQQNTVALALQNNIQHHAQVLEATAQEVKKLQHKQAQLQNTVQENRSLSSRGIASIAAMANIPVPAIVGKTNVGAGVGHFDTKTAVAVGMARYYMNGTAVKVSVGTAGAKMTVGGGVSYSF